jgi:hypothetical protein
MGMNYGISSYNTLSILELRIQISKVLYDDYLFKTNLHEENNNNKLTFDKVDSGENHNNENIINENIINEKIINENLINNVDIEKVKDLLLVRGRTFNWRFTEDQIALFVEHFINISISPNLKMISDIYSITRGVGEDDATISRNMISKWFQTARTELDIINNEDIAYSQLKMISKTKINLQLEKDLCSSHNELSNNNCLNSNLNLFESSASTVDNEDCQIDELPIIVVGERLKYTEKGTKQNELLPLDSFFELNECVKVLMKDEFVIQCKHCVSTIRLDSFMSTHLLSHFYPTIDFSEYHNLIQLNDGKRWSIYSDPTENEWKVGKFSENEICNPFEGNRLSSHSNSFKNREKRIQESVTHRECSPSKSQLNEETHNSFAIKIRKIRPEHFDDSEMALFQREVWLLSHLSHPYLVPFLKWSLSPFSILIPYYPIGNLRDYMANSKLSPQQCLIFSFQIASAFQYLHSFHPSVVHLHFKSSKVFLKSEFTGSSNGDYLNLDAMVSDYGRGFLPQYSKQYRDHCSYFQSSHQILPPLKNILLKVDIYSFGKLLHEMHMNCPEQQLGLLKNLEIKCQHTDPLQRPSFDEIVCILKEKYVESKRRRPH